MEEQGETTFSFIDNYCERINFDGEILNTITNFAFLIAGVILLRKLHRSNSIRLRNFDIILLSFTIISIGLGSAIYHYNPNKFTLNLDVLPIAIFIHLLLLSLLLRVFNLRIFGAVFFFFLFIGAGIFSEIYFERDMLNGTIMYMPTYLSLWIIVLALKMKSHPQCKYIFNTAIIWTFSLLFRTVDMELCDITFGIGTHIFWHILNAIVLYRLVNLLIRDSKYKTI